MVKKIRLIRPDEPAEEQKYSDAILDGTRGRLYKKRAADYERWKARDPYEAALWERERTLDPHWKRRQWLEDELRDAGISQIEIARAMGHKYPGPISKCIKGGPGAPQLSARYIDAIATVLKKPRQWVTDNDAVDLDKVKRSMGAPVAPVARPVRASKPTTAAAALKALGEAIEAVETLIPSIRIIVEHGDEEK